jgi:glycosyltransferase involved in cell wall biosynthesis
MRILVIAPGAPPKNSPESIQVGRHLAELCGRHEVTLVTTPVERGWVGADPALAMRAELARIELGLPLHAAAVRVLGSRLAARWRVPDKDFWIVRRAGHVLRRLDTPPDVVYSRSTPFSAALLARELAAALPRPWVMHLSDPWADSPYREAGAARNAVEQRLEAACFASASAITVTTQAQAGFYARKYPGAQARLSVSPNVLPRDWDAAPDAPAADGPLTVVYAGALYGRRRPTALLAALRRLRERDEPSLRSLRLRLAGNVTPDIEAELRQAAWGQLELLGHLDQRATRSLLASAHVLLSLEPEGAHELTNAFFPSKLLDYLAARRPILAIAPKGGEAWKLCAEGYGWAHEPADEAGIAERLGGLVRLQRAGRWTTDVRLPPLPSRLRAEVCVAALEGLLAGVVAAAGPPSSGGPR